jgi:hypothetical protein
MPQIIPGLAYQEPENFVKATIEIAGQWDFNLASGTYPLCQVPSGYVVDEVVTVVSQVFDGSPTGTIGDGDDADGYLDSTDIAPGTALTASTPALKRSRNSSNPYANGKYYPSADSVDLVWVQGTNPTTGVMKFFITLRNLKKGGVPASLTSTTPL